MQIRPVNRSRSEARQAYDRLSRFYDMLSGSSEAPLKRMGLAMLQVGPGETVLEVGCGTGQSLVEIANLVGTPGTTQGLDLSEGMLVKAKDKLEKSGNAQKVLLVQGDGIHLPYPNVSYAAVFLSFTLELFDTPEIPLVLAECRRVLKPAGRMGVVALYKPAHSSQAIRLYEWMHDHLPAYVDCRPINSCDLIQAANFTIEKHITKSMWGLPVELVVARKA
jgi:ubiquinone/menaquinone biosynthesis C-methylase UbiE